MKDKITLLIWILTISLSTTLLSCRKEPNKFQWQPGISAPKFYPVGGVSVDFNVAGNGSLTNFDNGWGNQYGSVVSGDKYKEVPKEVHIKYYSAVDNLEYKGTVNLPQEKLLALFQKYNKQYSEQHKGKDTIGFMSSIIVGMAPGGWVRVWYTTSDFDKFENIEVAKTRLKGIEDPTIEDNFRYKTGDYWTKYKNYWQHHGIPYQAWANNEKEYYYDMKFVSPNKDSKLDRSYIVSSDGWYSSFYSEEPSDNINDISNKGWKSKLPVHLSVSWINKSNSTYYDTNIVMPKSLKKVFEETYIPYKKYTYSNFIIELENDNKHSNVYLKTKDKTIKLLRFKGELSKKGNQDFGNYMYAKEIEYFVP